MHLLDIDWLEFARRAHVWRDLAQETRAALLRLEPSAQLPAGSLGGDAERLREANFLVRQTNGRMPLHASHRPHHAALRAMSRRVLRAGNGRDACTAYIQEHFTNAERDAIWRHLINRGVHSAYGYASPHTLARLATSAAWVRQALDGGGVSEETASRGGNAVGGGKSSPRATALPGAVGAIAPRGSAAHTLPPITGRSGRPARGAGRAADNVIVFPFGRRGDPPGAGPWMPGVEAAQEAPGADSDSADPHAPITAAELRALTRAVLENGGSIGVEALHAAGVVTEARFSAAVFGALSGLILFATLEPETLAPRLMFWPSIAARLTEPPPASPRPLPAPAELFESPILAGDAAALLVAAAAEPFRLRANDGAIYARDERRIQEALAPLPDFMVRHYDLAPDMRQTQAVLFLLTLNLLVEKSGSGTGQVLAPTRKARDWLSLDPAERLRSLADLVRVEAPATDGDINDDDDFDDDDFDDEEEFDFEFVEDIGFETDFGADNLPGGGTGWAPNAAGGMSGAGHGLRGKPRLGLCADARYGQPLEWARLEAALAQTLATLPAGEFVELNALLRHAARTLNPLIQPPAGFPTYIGGLHLAPLTDEEREGLWRQQLEFTLVRRLLPLGGLAAGVTAEGLAAVSLTDIGRYILGQTERFTPPALPAAGDARIVVQPNFDIVFLTPSPAAEAAIAPFAERVGSEPVGTLFRLTRAAAIAASAAGLTARHAHAALADNAQHALPANVEREISGWFDSVRHVTGRAAYLLHCPDAATARQVAAAAGKKATLIAPTILELADPRELKTIVRKLKAKGVFITEEGGKGGKRGARR